MAISSSTGTTSSGGLFQIPGLGGIDTTSIQQALVTAAQAPVTLLQSQQAVLTQQQTAWRQVNSSVLALGTAANAFDDSTISQNRTASSDNTSVLTATADPGQGLGNYAITVKAVAQQHQMISGGYAASDAVLGTGTISIQVGPASFSPITIDKTNNTLSGVAAAINKANVGITASVVDAGDAAGNSRYRLLIESNTSGTAGKVQASFNLNGAAPAMTDLVAAQDAHLQLGSGSAAVDVYSSSNTITNVVPGVTLQLKGTSDTPVNVSLSQDTTALSSAIKGLLSSYNSLNSQFTSNFAYDSTTNTAGTLFGNTTLIGLQQSVNSQVTGSRNVGGTYSNLTDIGITLDASGNLSITNQTAFQKALTNSPTDVMKLFKDPTSGIATQLKTMVSSYTDASSGILSQQDTSLTNNYNELQKQIDDDNKLATDEQTRISDMFTQLQASLATLKSTSDYVAAQIASYSNTSSSSSSRSSG